MQEYTNNPFVGSKVIQELKIGTRKNMQYDPQQSPVQLIQQLENMDYLAYEIVERLKDKEPVVRQILKEQNDIDYLMDMHQEYYTNENKRENSLVYKLQNQYLSDIETQRIISNIPLCPGNIIELDTNEHQMLQLSPVMYLISVNWATTNQNIIKEYFHRWVPIVPYNENLYVAMYSPNTSKIQENKTIHQKQFINVYNHRYIFNYKYDYLLNLLPRTNFHLTYNGQLYKLERDNNTDPNVFNATGYKVLSKLVKDFTNVSTNMLPIEKLHTDVISSVKQDLKNVFLNNAGDDNTDACVIPSLKQDLFQKIVDNVGDSNTDPGVRASTFLEHYIPEIQNSFNNHIHEILLPNNYQIINIEELSSLLFEPIRQFIIQLDEYKSIEENNEQYKQQLNHQVDKIVQDTIYNVQFDSNFNLLDTQNEYFSPNQDYMFCIRQYQFTNQNQDIFRICSPENNIFSNVYVYSAIQQ